MFKKIIIAILLYTTMLSSTFAYQEYTDQLLVSQYKEYIEKKVGDKIKQKSVSFRVDLLVKIEKILDTYADKKVSEKKKQQTINALIALQEVVEATFESQIASEQQVLQIRIIDDKRCTKCITDSIIAELKKQPGLDTAEFIYQDFSDTGVSEFMKQNNIQKLPAVIFSEKDFEWNTSLAPYLQELSGWEYTLSVWSSFDPFLMRSAKGFLVLDRNTREKIFQRAHIQGSSTAQISLVEYSDLECPFCARLHNAGTISQLQETFGKSLNFTYKHFPLSFHPEAEILASALECVHDQVWTDGYYNWVDAIYANGYSLSEFYDNIDSISVWVDDGELKKCVDSERHIEFIQSQMSEWMELFNVTGTPSVVVVNNLTGEYEKVWGAYPYEHFVEVIEKILK